MSPWKEAKFIPPEKLEDQVEEIRRLGKTIVTLNGTFDLLHVGHLSIIYEASRQGDVLILALNSDASVKQYKGVSRPIIPLDDRLEIVAALEFVDYVTYFEERTPISILEKIKPDVHTNGTEYGRECIEATVIETQGGRLYLAPLVPGISTSKIIEKIVTCV